MTRVLFLAVIAVFLTATAAGAQVVLKDNPRHTINGAQVFVMDAAYKNNVGAFFKEAKAKGVDTVFFRVFHNSGDRPHFGMAPQCKWGVYFKTIGASCQGSPPSRHKNLRLDGYKEPYGP